MIQRLSVWNFQSIKFLELDLAPFTVIVGPSSSGKSALLRAATALGRNSVSLASGLRLGEKAFTVSAEFEDYGVSLTRGERVSEYTLLIEGGEQKYPKSGTSVPQAAQDLLRFAEAEGADLTFSTQHDGPFLMSAPGSTVARVLGSLTAATMLHDAVKEANRRKLARNRQAETRRSDASSGRQKALAYPDLKKRSTMLADARAALEAVEQGSVRLRTLQGLRDNWDALQSALTTHSAETKDLTACTDLIESVATSTDALSSLAGLLYDWEAVLADLDFNALEMSQVTEALPLAEQAVHAELHALGTCPTCGQSTADIK